MCNFNGWQSRRSSEKKGYSTAAGSSELISANGCFALPIWRLGVCMKVTQAKRVTSSLQCFAASARASFKKAEELKPHNGDHTY